MSLDAPQPEKTEDAGNSGNSLQDLDFFKEAYSLVPDAKTDTTGQGTVPRNFDERPQAPEPRVKTDGTTDQTVPATGDTTAKPPTGDNAEEIDLFPLRYNDLPTDGQPKKDLGENPFHPDYNEIEPPKDKGADQLEEVPFKGSPRPFSENGESGNLYVDESTGYVVGIEYVGGTRAGQRQVFDRDESGNVTKMHISAWGEGGERQRSAIEKTADGWRSLPEGKLPPGFTAIKPENGLIPGDFKVNDKGDIKWEAPDQSIKEVIRVNGTHDTVDMRDYSRTRETVDGKKSVDYWDGYEWRAGKRTVGDNGVVQVDFDGTAGKPVRTTRNWAEDGFKVDFGDGKTQFQIDSWNKGKLTRVHNGSTDTLYNTGTKNKDDRVVWMKGKEQAQEGKMVVDFTGEPTNSTRIAAGELPANAVIDVGSGRVTSSFTSGATVVSDMRGQRQRITYKGGETVEVVHDVNDKFRGIRHSNGVTVNLAEASSATVGGQSQHAAVWRVQRPGQQPVDVPGNFQYGAAGAFAFGDGEQNSVVVSTEGVMMGNFQGQKFGPERTADTEEPGEKTDKPPEVEKGKEATDEQLQALAAKYGVDVGFLKANRDRALAGKLGEHFTEENVGKFLELAKKHDMIGDFKEQKLNLDSTPGAVVGKIMPELMTNPDQAFDAVAESLKQHMEAQLKAGGADAGKIQTMRGAIDQQFAALKAKTAAFVADLKASLS